MSSDNTPTVQAFTPDFKKAFLSNNTEVAVWGSFNKNLQPASSYDEVTFVVVGPYNGTKFLNIDLTCTHNLTIH